MRSDSRLHRHATTWKTLRKGTLLFFSNQKLW
ncbi:unnamed protein product [Spirodela intermedia]|uniref:Uncharacterized protein n=1 Tax=Spirodela intermedia TaxID=51605 RepID=A0A7I8IWW8_SPIIN|nr:unnamed protein product [Spirodela intermedia]CAA6661651.1 unnamed protein product [Spirodela intermedia]